MFVLVFVAIVGAVSAADNNSTVVESDVIRYSENFLEEIKNQTIVLVRFGNLPELKPRTISWGKICFGFEGTTWCGYCKAMAADLEKAATMLKNFKVGAIGEVDCTSGPKQVLCGKLLINGYPTIKLYKNGKFNQEYYGARTAESMVYFVQKQSLLP